MRQLPFLRSVLAPPGPLPARQLTGQALRPVTALGYQHGCHQLDATQLLPSQPRSGRICVLFCRSPRARGSSAPRTRRLQRQQALETTEAAGPGMDAAAAAAVAGAAADGALPRNADGAAAASPSGRPECYVILYTVSKKHNVGTLLRSCTAFGVTQVRVRAATAAAHALALRCAAPCIKRRTKAATYSSHTCYDETADRCASSAPVSSIHLAPTAPLSMLSCATSQQSRPAAPGCAASGVGDQICSGALLCKGTGRQLHTAVATPGCARSLVACYGT